jgi:hypothetical protein
VNKKTLTEVCFEMFTKEIELQRVPGFEDIEEVKLTSGEDGGGVKIYKGEKISKVTLADIKYGNGIPIPHRKNRIGMAAELFQVIPDFSYKLPIWGVDSITFEDGTYWFDTDFFFGIDLVMDYEFTMQYLDPFNEIYTKFSYHKDLEPLSLAEVPAWVRAHISPAYIIAETKVEKVDTVYELCSEFIKLWVRMYRDAEKRDAAFKESQQKRITSIYGRMQDTEKMAEILRGIYGEETFAKFFRAILPKI